MSRTWLPLSVIEELEPLAKAWRVSEVARGPGGFMRQYRKAGGDPSHLDDWWYDRRNAFVARHMAQITLRDEPLWRETASGRFPSPRHLALIFWAYTPDRPGLLRFLKRWDGDISSRPSGRNS